MRKKKREKQKRKFRTEGRGPRSLSPATTEGRGPRSLSPATTVGRGPRSLSPATTEGRGPRSPSLSAVSFRSPALSSFFLFFFASFAPRQSPPRPWSPSPPPPWPFSSSRASPGPWAGSESVKDFRENEEERVMSASIDQSINRAPVFSLDQSLLFPFLYLCCGRLLRRRCSAALGRRR